MKNERYDVPVEEYIGSLFAETVDGKLTITHFPDDGGEPYDATYPMDWDFDVACDVARRFVTLREHLERLGLMHNALQDSESARKLLNEEEFLVWQTYVMPFDAFDTDQDEIFELMTKEEYGELTEEETALLDRYYDWFEQQCLKRLPRKRRSSVGFINRAKRYERLVFLKAPEIIMENEAYCLAEEMVLYYCMAAE